MFLFISFNYSWNVNARNSTINDVEQEGRSFHEHAMRYDVWVCV